MLTLAVAAMSISPARYSSIRIQGWTVRVAEAELQQPNWRSARAELETQLYRIAHVVPDAPLKKLRSIPIWVNEKDPGTQCMAYHPDVAWLRDHGMNPDMEHGVEIGNPGTFVSWTYEQPWMVLHELAHAYHDRFLPDGFENARVKGVWQSEMSSKRYDQVLHWDGKTVKHYGETNQMEFFAECTEAYFGQNDFYPFVNSELRTFDPDAFSLMESIWGTPQKRT